MRILTGEGFSLPLWLDDYLAFQSIATTAYDPIATYQASSKTTYDEATMNIAIRGGFAVQNATDTAGFIWAVTLRQFEDYLKTHKDTLPSAWSLAAIVPRKIYLAGSDWAFAPLIKVYAGNHGTYPSSVTTIVVGRIS
jgi:hypothetical protein